MEWLEQARAERGLHGDVLRQRQVRLKDLNHVTTVRHNGSQPGPLFWAGAGAGKIQAATAQ